MAGLNTYCGMRVKMSAAEKSADLRVGAVEETREDRSPVHQRLGEGHAQPAPARRTWSACPVEKASPSRSGGGTGAGLTASTPMSGREHDGEGRSEDAPSYGEQHGCEEQPRPPTPPRSARQAEATACAR